MNRLSSRVENLTSKLSDAENELAFLKVVRKEVSKAVYARKTKSIKNKIEKLSDDLYYARKDLSVKKSNEKVKFFKNLDKGFKSDRAFDIPFGNPFVSDVDVLKYIARQPERRTIQVQNKYYVLNDNTRNRIQHLIETDLIVDEEATESESAMVQTINEAGSIGVAPVTKPNNAYAFLEGAFFKWFHNTHFDLTRLAIFRDEKEANYDDNCFMVALRSAGVPETKLELIKMKIQNRNVSVSSLNAICDILQVNIQLKTADIKNNYRRVYGKKYDTTYNIALLENHYFNIEPMNITSYCLNNYEAVKDEKDCHRIFRTKGKYLERDDKHYIDSYDVVKCLLNNQEKLLKEITMEQSFIAKTQFYDKVSHEITNLAFDVSGCCLPIVKKNGGNPIAYKNVFFDFETYVKDGVHVPYLCRTYDGQASKAFLGVDCAKKMLFSLDGNTRLIAHNATYDLRFIIGWLTQITELARGNRLISLQAKFCGFDIEVKDSYHLITMALNKFPKVFGMKNIVKEVMPYDIYNEGSVAQRFYPIDEALTHVADEDKEQFLNNIKLWKLQKGDTYDMIEYSSRYCEIDCKILHDGYNTFRGWILEQLALDTNEILTSASLADKYFIHQGCYDDVFQLGGIPQMFIQGCIVGGRTMTANNKKNSVSGRINDFDAVSLYPSAMRRMDGFLKGVPKVIENLDYSWVKQQDGYFVDILIKSVGVQRSFPLMSIKNENGVRMFNNDMVGKTMRVDRYTLEDLITYHNITFDVVRGYYFNEGFNKQVNDTIVYLFNQRLAMKKEGNPAELVYKLIMNSGYGKSIMKPVLTESRFFDDEESFFRFLDRHYNWVVSYVRFGDKIKATLVKPIIDHFNRCQVGAMILSMSKRIMNEVMCLAEDNGLEMFYQDTDSIHIRDADISTLAKLYKSKHGRELIGNGLGQFHSDFELHDAENVYARRSIFLGKKCYIDELSGFKDGGEVVGYHIRMKGIPNRVILYHVKKLGYANPFDMYQDLYEGKEIAYDLTNDGHKANFKFNKDYTINTLSIFTRKIRFQ